MRRIVVIAVVAGMVPWAAGCQAPLSWEVQGGTPKGQLLPSEALAQPIPEHTPSFDLMVVRLQDPNPEVRGRAAQDLGGTGKVAAIPYLVTMFRDTAKVRELGWEKYEPRVCDIAVRALGKIRHQDSVKCLGSLLADSDVMIRCSAVIALGEIGGPEAWETTKPAVMDENRDVRDVAVRVFWKAGADLALGVLAGMLKDGRWEVRECGAWALGGLGNPAGVPFLRRSMQDDEMHVRLASAKAIAAIGGKQATEIMLAAMTDTNASTRVIGAEYMHKAGNAEAIRVLRHVLKQGPRQCDRIAAAEAFGRLGTPDDLPVLESALADTDEEVRREVGWAIERIRSRKISAQ